MKAIAAMLRELPPEDRAKLTEMLPRPDSPSKE